MEVRNIDNQPTDNTLQKETKTSVKSKSKANIFCGFSLGLFLATVLSATGIFLTYPLVNDAKMNDIFFLACASGVAAYESSLVLAIVARINFSESKFAKVLLWFHISVVIAFSVALIGYCAYCISHCGPIPG